MKNKDAFEKWFNENYKSLIGDNPISVINSHKCTWEACEQFYESKKCEDCKEKLRIAIETLEGYCGIGNWVGVETATEALKKIKSTEAIEDPTQKYKKLLERTEL